VTSIGDLPEPIGVAAIPVAQEVTKKLSEAGRVGSERFVERQMDRTADNYNPKTKGWSTGAWRHPTLTLP